MTAFSFARERSVPLTIEGKRRWTETCIGKTEAPERLKRSRIVLSPGVTTLRVGLTLCPVVAAAAHVIPSLGEGGTDRDHATLWAVERLPLWESAAAWTHQPPGQSRQRFTVQPQWHSEACRLPGSRIPFARDLIMSEITNITSSPSSQSRL